MCRTCEIMGMCDYITLGENKIDMRPSLGSHNYLNFKKYKCDLENEKGMKDKFDFCMSKYQMVPIFIEQGGVSLSQVDWNHYQNDHLCFN